MMMPPGPLTRATSGATSARSRRLRPPRPLVPPSWGTVGSVPASGVGTLTATVIGQDSYDYSSNSQGQLIREATNVFTDGGFEDFRKGEYAGTRADSATGTVALTRIEGTRCPVEGTYTSMFFDAGRTTTFGIATWTADVPAGASLRFQVAVSSTAGGPWVFVGLDGTTGSYFTSSGTACTTPPTGRYVCYRAPFASDAARLASPTLSGFNLSLGGASNRVVSYTYGANGNVVSRTTVDSATGTTTDVRDSVTWPASDRINTQDQLLRRDVTSPDGTTVTWRYTYDSAGNMTSKTDGTQTTSYAWDSHNRLVQVTVPDGTSEAYTYDGNGLMLSSRKSTDTAAATYGWRGNDVVQETAPDGTVTRYNVVNGVLTSFVRGGETYTVQSDATVGHVRSVTDSNGTVVYTARYDAWGNVLAVTDNVPGGMPARYVGALGVRRDGDLGVYCMRHRWYDPQLQQFLSKDSLKSNADLYEYANDDPGRLIDPLGLKIGIERGDGFDAAMKQFNTIFLKQTGCVLKRVLKRAGRVDPAMYGFVEVVNGGVACPVLRVLILSMAKKLGKRKECLIRVTSGLRGPGTAKGAPRGNALPQTDSGSIGRMISSNSPATRVLGVSSLIHELAEAEHEESLGEILQLRRIPQDSRRAT